MYKRQTQHIIIFRYRNFITRFEINLSVIMPFSTRGSAVILSFFFLFFFQTILPVISIIKIRKWINVVYCLSFSAPDSMVLEVFLTVLNIYIYTSTRSCFKLLTCTTFFELLFSFYNLHICNILLYFRHPFIQSNGGRFLFLFLKTFKHW